MVSSGFFPSKNIYTLLYLIIKLLCITMVNLRVISKLNQGKFRVKFTLGLV